MSEINEIDRAWFIAQDEWDRQRLQPGTYTAFATGFEAAQATAEKYRAALEEIQKCEGAFSRDPLTHATNVIESAERIAREALSGNLAEAA